MLTVSEVSGGVEEICHALPREFQTQVFPKWSFHTDVKMVARKPAHM